MRPRWELVLSPPRCSDVVLPWLPALLGAGEAPATRVSTGSLLPSFTRRPFCCRSCCRSLNLKCRRRSAASGCRPTA